MDIDVLLKQSAEAIVPSKDLRDRTLLRAVEATSCYPARTSLRKPVLAAVMVAVILGLASIGYASGLFSPRTMDEFTEQLGDSETQQSIIEQLGVPLDISVTSYGYTVTAEAMLNDGKVLAVLYRISREDGEPLLPADVVNYKNLIFSSWGAENLNYMPIYQDGDPMNYISYTPGDTEGYYLHTVVKNDPDAETYNFYFLSLQAWYTDAEENLTDRNASWKFDFTVAPAEEGLTLAENATFQKNGEEFLIRGIHVSPLSITVDYTVLSDTPSHRAEEVYETNSDGSVSSAIIFHEEAFTDNIDLILRLKDGREIDLSTITEHNNTNLLGWVEVKDPFDEEGTFIVHRGAVLPEIIPYEQMDCVIFNDTEYKVTQDDDGRG